MFSFVLMVIATSFWVYFDARAIGVKRGQVAGLGNLGPGAWFLACLLLWPLAFPFYFTQRPAFRHANGWRLDGSRHPV